MTNPTSTSANQPIVPCLLAPYWQQVRETLCPLLHQGAKIPLTDTLQRLAQILEIVRIEEFVAPPLRGRRGNQPLDRRPIARAFLATAILNLSDTRQLMEQLHQSPALRFVCGIPLVPIPRGYPPTFSRAFATFTKEGIAQKAHQALLEKFVSKQRVMHASHDTTAVEAGEKPKRKVTPREKKRGRPQKGEETPKEPTRVERQGTMEPTQALSELSTVCDWGVKHDTDGNEYRWRGYKAPLVWADGMIPLAWVTTSASVHDSQAVIPLMKQVATSVTSLYDLMDSAYDVPSVRAVRVSLGHVPLIDHNKR